MKLRWYVYEHRYWQYYANRDMDGWVINHQRNEPVLQVFNESIQQWENVPRVLEQQDPGPVPSE